MGSRSAESAFIRGTLFSRAVGELNALVDGGKVTREELARSLDARDLAQLIGRTDPSAWYPFVTFRRLSELVNQKTDRLDDEAQIAYGETGYALLRQTGLFTAVGAVEKSDPASLAAFYVGVASRVYTFLTWTVTRADSHSIELEIEEAETLPRWMLCRFVGFVRGHARHVLGRGVRASWTRLAPDRVLLTADLESAG